jgi:predicted DNA-binding transcriptional regulator AlpA
LVLDPVAPDPRTRPEWTAGPPSAEAALERALGKRCEQPTQWPTPIERCFDMTRSSKIRAALAVVVVHPERLANLPSDMLPDAIGETEALRARLLTRLLATAAVEAKPGSKSSVKEPDVLFTASQAAERLGVDRRWMYRQAGRLPFTRRLSSGTLRFSRAGLERWIESKR